MSDQENPTGKSKLRLILGSLLGVLAAGGVVGYIVYSSICPCDFTPGGYLFGDEVEEVVTDWTFANEVELCQIQIWAGIRPHSVNLNCMATPEGKLYLSCSVCDTKYWAGKVGEDEGGRLRLNGAVYPIIVNRVQDPDEMDRAWRARDLKLNTKIQNPVGAPRPGAPRADGWWTFNVVSSL